MGKRRTRSKYTSNGERRSVSRETLKLMKRSASEIDKGLNIIQAWRAGKNPWITISGITTRERFVKVRANDYYGDPKKSTYGIFRGKSDE